MFFFYLQITSSDFFHTISVIVIGLKNKTYIYIYNTFMLYHSFADTISYDHDVDQTCF